METEIKLNEQQSDFLRNVLEERTDEPYSKFTHAIALSILKKLENE